MTEAESPVISFGHRYEPTEPQPDGAFQLARAVDHQGRWGREYFFVDKADPVTTRVLQNHNFKPEAKMKWLTDFVLRKPPDPLLCWLVVMGAVSIEDVFNAIGEYGWSMVNGTVTDSTHVPARCRLADVAGDVGEFRRRVEWALVECESHYGMEWLDKDDAATLFSACEARLKAEAQDRAS